VNKSFKILKLGMILDIHVFWF